MRRILIIFTVLLLFSSIFISCSKSSDDGSKSTDNTTTTDDTTAPTVSSTSPSDSASSVSIGSTISVTFSESIDNSSVTANTSNTTCSESMQLSSNNFSSCIQMSSTPSASNTNKTFSVTPSDNLSSETSYKIRVTTLVKDVVGNSMSNSYTTSNGFTTADITSPILSQVSAITSPTNDTTPDYTFSSSESGSITYGGSCSSSTTSAISGNNTITLVSLSDGTYSNCTITVTDNSSNSVTLNINSFVIDTTAPVIWEGGGVTTPPNDNTPDYGFEFSEAGTITFGGPCSSGTTSTSEISGGRITFNALSDGTYSNCTIIVTDSAGNASNTLSISSFIIDTVSYDDCVDSNTMCLTLTWTDGLDPDLHSYYFPDWTYEEEETNGFDNTSRGTRYWVYGNAANKKYSETGQTIQLTDGNSSSDNETQVWATDSQKVGNGTYLVYVEDIAELDVQNFKIVLSGPGLSDNITYGPYDFKDDDNDLTTEALNPQAVFFIQVDNNIIKLSDNFTVGDNLSSSTLMQWTGPMKKYVLD